MELNREKEAYINVENHTFNITNTFLCNYTTLYTLLLLHQESSKGVLMQFPFILLHILPASYKPVNFWNLTIIFIDNSCCVMVLKIKKHIYPFCRRVSLLGKKGINQLYLVVIIVSSYS